MNLEDLYEAYLVKKEEDAWNEVKNKLTSDKLTYSTNELIKGAFLIGYGKGGIDRENEILEISKNDPIQFYNWVSGKI
ncbi:hypothetical protein AAHH67_15785 [Niallia circulans]